MASFLENLLRDELAKGFKGKLLSGIISRSSSSSTNEYGYTVGGVTTNYICEGFVENYSDFYRLQAGISENDVKVILIAGNTQIEPKKDDLISFSGYPSYKVREIKTDPAKATYECQSFSV